MVQVLHILPPSKISWGPRKFRRQTVADFCLFLGRRACVLGDHRLIKSGMCTPSLAPPLHRVGYVHALSRPCPRRGPPCPYPARPSTWRFFPSLRCPDSRFPSCSSATAVRAAPLTLAVVPASSALFSCGRSASRRSASRRSASRLPPRGLPPLGLPPLAPRARVPRARVPRARVPRARVPLAVRSTRCPASSRCTMTCLWPRTSSTRAS